MDASEATRIVMSRIQSLDPKNASRIMGYILIQDQGEKEMIRLAFGPDALLLSCINRAKTYLALNSSNPLSNSLRQSNLFPQASPRILIPNNVFHYSNPSSPAAAAAPCPRSSPGPISYAAVVNGGSSSTGSNSSSINDSPSQFYGGNDIGDEFLSGGGDAATVDPIMSPSGRSDSLIFRYGEDANSVAPPHHHPFHRRSHSVNDAVFLSNLEEEGFGCRPCMYFAKGFCKNGSDCKFIHGDNGGDEAIEVGSPSSGYDEFLRMKVLQQQRFAVMASGGGRHPFSFNKGINSLNENQRCGPRNEFSPMGLGAAMTSSSRQIYLTFPADSTFKEEDVSSYFSMFGPVQDVRIPYQQKRMFGFVTFVYPETVKLILAKGNPHYVCDSRVLVKPYKEKGKVPDKKQFQQRYQHLERGEYSSCLSPSGIDSKELFDSPIGPRMLSNTQEMMLRRKMEQEVELQHVIELQSRRMTNLQLMDLKCQQHNHQFLPSLPSGVSISSPRRSQFLMGDNVIASNAGNQDVLQEFDNGQEISKSTAVAADDESSLEHILPDNLFSSPTKSAVEHQSIFSHAPTESDDPLTTTSSNTSPVLPSSSPLGMASLC